MDISGLGNGEHQLKAISSDSNSHITCSNIKPVTFSNPFTYCSLPKHYEPNQPLYFAGIYNSTGNVSVNVYANGGNLRRRSPIVKITSLALSPLKLQISMTLIMSPLRKIRWDYLLQAAGPLL